MSGRKKGPAPERDDQAFRKQSLLRRGLEKIGLHNQVLAHNLVQQKQILDSGWREDNVDAVYDGDKVVSFRERGTGIDYKVVDSFAKKSLKEGCGTEQFCIIQQSHGQRYFALLKYDPSIDKWMPAPIRYDKALGDRTGTLNMFFTKKYVIIPGGIEYQLTNSCRPITENKIRSN